MTDQNLDHHDPDPRRTETVLSEAAPTPIGKPERIGAYRILHVLGEGGMGVVYLAEQEKPIHRRVALKLIKLGMDTRQVIARFEAEREALAMMNHPNVAKVHDAGATEQGRPYFVMEYVEGVPLTYYCDRNRLSTKDRLKLFMQVCHAVQHAHQKGIIHRDLKPSNVLVTKVDDAPAVKVIDFGIAKATQQRLAEVTLFTEQGQLVGTPAYMSPEQADPTTQDIDTRTDIYSLGVILYELLVGTLPFDTKTLLRGGFAEIQRIIREVDPPKPSTRLNAMSEPRTSVRADVQDSQTLEVRGVAPVRDSARSKDRGSLADIAHRRHAEPKTLIRQIRGDLDWIVMKCLEKDRTRRYDTANGLAMEIQRYLNQEPVLAGPPTTRYRLNKFVRRNKGPVAASVVVTFVLIGGILGTSYGMAKAVHAREREAEQRMFAEESERRAIAARDEAEQVTQFLSDTLAAADPSMQGKDVTVREVLEQASEKIGEKFAGKPLIEARLKNTVGWTYHGLGLYDRAEDHLADSAAIYRRVLGERDPRTLGATSVLAFSISTRGKYSASEASLRSTLEIQRRVLGEEHRDTLTSMNNLAKVLEDQGSYPEAEELHRKTLEIRRRVLGEEHPDTLPSMNNLGLVLDQQGRYPEAEALYRKTLEIQRRLLGEEHPDALASMNNLANVLYGQGRYPEAEELHRKTLEIRRRVLGEKHPNTLASMNNLASVLDQQGRYPEAEELHRKTLEISRRILGEGHPDTLNSMNNLANVLDDQGRSLEAEELHRKTLEISRRVLGEEHPSTLNVMNNLAVVVDRQGRYPEAEELHRKTLEISRRVLGQEHPRTLGSMNNLARVLDQHGRHAEAEELYRKTLGISRRLLGDENPDVAESLGGLATVLEKTERFTEAEPLSREAASILALRLPPEHRDRETNANLLGGILSGLGRYSEAEPLLFESYEALRDDLGISLGDKKDMIERWIRLYESWDVAEPGKGYADKAAEWRAKLPSENPPP